MSWYFWTGSVIIVAIIAYIVYRTKSKKSYFGGNLISNAKNKLIDCCERARGFFGR